MLWTPADDWRVTYVADISNDDSGSTIPTRIASPTGGACAPAVADCSPLFGSPYKTGINTLRAGYARSRGQSLRVEYDAGPVVIKSISAYQLGRASCRERGCKYGYQQVVTGPFIKK